LKVNVDAAFCSSSQESAYGIVFRDHHGSITLAASLIGGKCASAEEAEAQAIWEGMNLAVAHNLIPTILESDCAVAVSTVNSRTPDVSKSWQVYNNIEVFKRIMPACIVSKVGRKCNGATHNLAQFARNRNWYAPVPVAVRELCNHDSVNSGEL
jgi:ribonuclease HI